MGIEGVGHKEDAITLMMNFVVQTTSEHLKKSTEDIIPWFSENEALASKDPSISQ
jgi:hypothetical protein